MEHRIINAFADFSFFLKLDTYRKSKNGEDAELSKLNEKINKKLFNLYGFQKH